MGEDIGGIKALGVDVHVVEAALHGALGHQDVLRLAGGGVDGGHGDHTADLVGGVDLVAGLDGQGAGHQLVVGGLVHQALVVILRAAEEAGVEVHAVGVGKVGLVVDLVVGHPVADLALVPLKAGAGKLEEKADHPAVFPSAVGLGQVQGHLKVAEGDHRFDAVPIALVEQVVVELEPCLVGGLLVPVGEDAGPCDGGAEALEAHLGKQADVLLVVVVKIDGVVAGVILAGQNAVGDPAGGLDVACGDHVGNAQALAVFLVGAFQLVGGHSAAPQEIFAETHGSFLLVSLIKAEALPPVGKDRASSLAAQGRGPCGAKRMAGGYSSASWLAMLALAAAMTKGR